MDLGRGAGGAGGAAGRRGAEGQERELGAGMDIVALPPLPLWGWVRRLGCRGVEKGCEGLPQ